MKTYTVFCVDTNQQHPTTWISSVKAADPESATERGRLQCADEWCCDESEVHVLGVASGDVDILEWNDLER